MYRGTTPTFIISLPNVDLNTLEEAYVTFKQNGRTIVEKRLSDCTINENKLYVTLSQEETLRFSSKTIATSQVRTKSVSGVCGASKIKEIQVNEILKEGVI